MNPRLDTLQLEPLTASVPQEAGTSLRGRTVGAAVRRRRAFLGLVGVPALLFATYFLFIAADRYVSEASFVVRSPSSGTASQLTALVGGTGVTRSSDDAYIVHAYLRSRDVVRSLEQTVALRTLLARAEADLFWRYPSPFLPDTQEHLWRHFGRLVAIDYDSTTGISTLSVAAFRPEDARVMAEALLHSAEALINRLSERARTDAIRAAEHEVERSREEAREALARITAFRRQHRIVDPGRTWSAAFETIARLSTEVALANAQISELATASPDSPQARSMSLRIAALQAQIDKERTALAGNDASLAPLIATYERLVLEREFADRAFTSAQQALDLARIDIERQRLFLERISTPGAADYPRYPHRIVNALMALAVIWMIFIVGRRLIADARSHADK